MNELTNIVYEQSKVGPVVKSFMEFNPIIGTVLIGIALLFIVNSFFKSQFDHNLLTSLLSFWKTKEEKNRIAREKYYKGTTEKEFVQWEEKVLKKIYADLPLVDLFAKKHLAVVHKAAEEVYYPFEDKLKKFGKLINLKVPELEQDRMQKRYYNMLSETIRRPNLIGFELDEYVLNADDEIIGFNANVCQYRHTVLTSHILEYELFKMYKKPSKKHLVNDTTEEILNHLPRRQAIHKGQINKDLIIKGKNRHSLLSVQMMIIAKSEKPDKYCTLLFKRSNEVALKPNYYHIIPAGGYEIFEKQGTENKYIIKQNFDIQLALFRELIEEVFNGKDFEENEQGEAKEIIYKHPAIIDLERMLGEGTAHMQFLGSVTDLTTLRPELSFLLMVDDPDFLKKDNFKINFEGNDLQIVPVEDLKELLEDELLYPSSAGLLELVKNSKLLQERGLAEFL